MLSANCTFLLVHLFNGALRNVHSSVTLLCVPVLCGEGHLQPRARLVPDLGRREAGRVSGKTKLAPFTLLITRCRPIDKSDKRAQFVACMSSKDFVRSHTPVVDLYRPLVSSFFIYAVCFGALGSEEDHISPLVQLDFALSGLQLGLTLIQFHVSWYSRSCQCWDAVGWWFMAASTVIVRAVIPIASLIITAIDLSNSEEFQSNVYDLLQVSHALTLLFSAMHFGFYAKRQLVDTFRWHRKRRNHSVKKHDVGDSQSES